MNIYIAARFSRRAEAHLLGKKLQALGHVIVSRWTRPGDDHVLATGMSAQAGDKERERFALEDLADVESSHMCVSLMEAPRSNGRGGRHVEFGYALGLGKMLIVIGPRETVFHHLPCVLHFDDEASFLKEVEGSRFQ